MIFSGIIWNAAYPYHNDILFDIGQLYPIKTVKHYDLADKYPDFVRSIYKLDTIPEFRIRAKLEAMAKFPTSSVVFFEINVPSPTKEYMERKRKFTFAQAEHLKESIRTKYSKLVHPYVFDIILHMTEDDKERQALLTCMKQFAAFSIAPKGK